MTKHKVNQMVYYTSDMLDKHEIKHGFFTRIGGTSLSPFATLNVKYVAGDATENVKENRNSICKSLGLSDQKLVFASLAHSNGIKIVHPMNAGQTITSVDALATTTANLPLMLSTADCIPILMATINKQVISIVHVGWRGLVAGVIENAVKTIASLSSEPMIAVLGPAISAASYEVGPELIASVSPKFIAQLKNVGNSRHFDLPGACRQELERLGVIKIDDLAIDTYSHTAEFYSHRREGMTGRFGSIISL